MAETENQKKRYELEMKAYKAKKAAEATTPEVAPTTTEAVVKKQEKKQKDADVKLAGKKRAAPDS